MIPFLEGQRFIAPATPSGGGSLVHASCADVHLSVCEVLHIAYAAGFMVHFLRTAYPGRDLNLHETGGSLDEAGQADSLPYTRSDHGQLRTGPAMSARVRLR